MAGPPPASSPRSVGEAPAELSSAPEGGMRGTTLDVFGEIDEEEVDDSPLGVSLDFATRLLGFVPTQEQIGEIEKVLAALDRGERLVMLTGSAGTGKTAMTKLLLHVLKRRIRGKVVRRVLRDAQGEPRQDEDGESLTVECPAWVLLVAPTWRALLRAWEATGHSRDCSRTAHGAIYAGPDPTAEEQLEQIEAEVRVKHRLHTGDPPPPLTPEASTELAVKAGALHAQLAGRQGKLSFTQPRKWPTDSKPEYVVLDEGSMIPEGMYEHFRQALGEVPLVVIGDYMQLPPVEGAPAFRLAEAVGRLRTVHRQGKGSPILNLLTEVRDSQVSLGRRDDIWARHGFAVLHKTAPEVGAWLAHYQQQGRSVICVVARHRTRRLVNDAVRAALGYPQAIHGPQVGERVVFRGHGGVTRTGGLGAYNGEFARVLAVGGPIRSPRLMDQDPGTDPLYDIIPIVVGVERGASPRRVAGVVLRGGFFPEDPRDEGRVSKDLQRRVRGAAGREQRDRGWMPGDLTQAFREAIEEAETRGEDEVAAMLAGATAAAAGRPLFALVDREAGFGVPIAAGSAVTTWVCLHPQTWVETPRGVESIIHIPPEGQIATPSGPDAYGNKVINPKGQMLRLTTAGGYELVGTPDHEILVWDGDAFAPRALEAIEPGATVRLKLGSTFVSSVDGTSLPPRPASDVRTEKRAIPTLLDEDLAEFLGLFVAVGSLRHGGWELTKRHPDVVERFAALSMKLFGVAGRRHDPKSRATRMVFNSTEVHDWLASIGGLSPKKKAVPVAVLTASPQVQAAFLRGLFEDGGASVKTRRDGIQALDHLDWSTRSEEMAQTVQYLLLRQGIPSTRRAWKKGERTHHHLYIFGAFAKLFTVAIGFVAKAKQLRCASAAARVCRMPMPLSQAQAMSLWDVGILSRKDLGVVRRSGWITRGLLQDRLARAGVVSPVADALLAWHYERVTCLSPAPDEVSVCVTVPSSGRFLQNGFDGHNCQGTQFEGVLVILENVSWLGDQEVNYWYTAASRARKLLVPVVLKRDRR